MLFTDSLGVHILCVKMTAYDSVILGPVCYERFRRVTSPHLFDRVACMFRSIERGRMVESSSASAGTSGKLTLAVLPSVSSC